MEASHFLQLRPMCPTLEALVNVPNSPTGLIMVQCAMEVFDISDNTFTINQITNDYTISTERAMKVCAQEQRILYFRFNRLWYVLRSCESIS